MRTPRYEYEANHVHKSLLSKVADRILAPSSASSSSLSYYTIFACFWICMILLTSQGRIRTSRTSSPYPSASWRCFLSAGLVSAGPGKLVYYLPANQRLLEVHAVCRPHICLPPGVRFQPQPSLPRPPNPSICVRTPLPTLVLLLRGYTQAVSLGRFTKHHLAPAFVRICSLGDPNFQLVNAGRWVLFFWL